MDAMSAMNVTTVEQPVRTLDQARVIDAVEIERFVPASGNLRVCGQQFWLGPAQAGSTLTLWMDITTDGGNGSQVACATSVAITSAAVAGSLAAVTARPITSMSAPRWMASAGVATRP
jgi:hypothetical protein